MLLIYSLTPWLRPLESGGNISHAYEPSRVQQVLIMLFRSEFNCCHLSQFFRAHVTWPLSSLNLSAVKYFPLGVSAHARAGRVGWGISPQEAIGLSHFSPV